MTCTNAMIAAKPRGASPSQVRVYTVSLWAKSWVAGVVHKDLISLTILTLLLTYALRQRETSVAGAMGVAHVLRAGQQG